MSEEQLSDEIPEVEAEDQEQEIEEVSPDEKRASRNGWVPKDQWKGEPDEWVSAKQFNARGNLMREVNQLKEKTNQLESGFESRVANLQKLYDLQLKELEGKRDSAIELADVAGAKRYQEQIDDMRQPHEAKKEEAKPAENQVLDTWNRENPWVFEDSPKAIYAKSVFASAVQRVGVEQAIEEVENAVAKHFPQTNPNRERAAAVEGGMSKPGRARGDRKLAWSDLTKEEEKFYIPGAWKSKEEYLQAVADSRKGQ